METNIFDKFVSQNLFKNKEHLRHNYRPANLPHRQEEIEKISYNLWEALTGHIPSNMTLYGVYRGRQNRRHRLRVPPSPNKRQHDEPTG